MNNLDLFTLCAAMALVNLAYVPIYIMVYAGNRECQFLKYMAISTTLLFVNAFLFMHADKIDRFLLSVATNSITLYALGLRYLVARDFDGHRTNLNRLGLYVLAAAVLALPFQLNGSFVLTYSFYTLVEGVSLLVTAYEFSRNRDDRLISRYALIICYGLIAIVFLVRSAWLILSPTPMGPLGMPDDFAQVFLFTSGLLASCTTSALGLSVAFERNARKRQEEAHRDFLTDTYNRRGIEQITKERFTDTSPGMVSIIDLDLDHFKLINDRHGHPVGDLVLQQCSRLIKKQLGPADLIARIGGEEFAIVLFDRTRQETSTVAEQIRRAIEAHVHQHGSTEFNVTISAGVYHTATPNPTLWCMIAQADQSLYKAKRFGRNRIIVDWEKHLSPDDPGQIIEIGAAI